MRGWRLAGLPARVKPIAVGEINVQPSVLVVVEEGQPAPLSLDDGPFVVDPAPNIGNVQPGQLSHIDKLDWRRRRIRYRGLQERRISPFPEGSCKSFGQLTAEDEEGGTEETPSRKNHRLR